MEMSCSVWDGYVINPWEIEAGEVDKEVLGLLKDWQTSLDTMHYSIRTTIRDTWIDNELDFSIIDTVWDEAGDEVIDAVGWALMWEVENSDEGDLGEYIFVTPVWAYVGSLFPLDKWLYVPHKEGEYPFQAGVDLWLRGFVPSYYDKVWRLHVGEDAHIVYSDDERRDDGIMENTAIVSQT